MRPIPMRAHITRRQWLSFAGAAVTSTALVGCSDSLEPQEARNWLGSLKGVDRVEADGKNLTLVLRPRLPEADVRTLADTLRKEFARHNPNDSFSSAITLHVDGFSGRLLAYPSSAPTDVDAVLWLRRDGRATSSTYDESTLVVTAPATAVGAIALGLHNRAEGRRYGSRRVRSKDGLSGVDLSGSTTSTTPARLAGLRHFAHVQSGYPGTTGWFDRNGRAALWFSPSHIGFDALIQRLPHMVDGAKFTELEFGWGPARADNGAFRTIFTGPLRTALNQLHAVPGVTMRAEQDQRSSDPRVSLTVRDGAGLSAAHRATTGLDGHAPIAVIRGTSPDVGDDGEAVISTSNRAAATEIAVLRVAADIPSVVRMSLPGSTGRLALASTITDAELTALLRPLTTYRDTFDQPATISVLCAEEREDEGVPIGALSAGRFVRETIIPNAQRAFVTRFEGAWRGVGGR